MKELDGVNDLFCWDEEVQDTKVRVETMTDEGTGEVVEDPKFLVDAFEMLEVVWGCFWVEVAGLEAGVLGFVVDDLTGDEDVVVDEGQGVG